MSNSFNYIAMNLTNRCNTYCRYCFQSAQVNDTDYLNIENVSEILKYVMTKASDDQKRILHLTGGEPTMNPDFFKILSFAVENGFTVRIQSNGLLWNSFEEKELELLNNNNVSIKISLDGWSEEIHGFLRAKNTYQKVVDNIKLLTKYCPVVGVKTCVHEKNIDELYRMLDVCKKLNVQGFSYSMLRQEGEALLHVPKEEFDIPEIRVAEKLIPYYNDPKYQYLMNGNNLLLYYYTSGNIRYQHHFYIDYDGKVYPHQSCIESECMGNVLQDGFEALDVEKSVKWGHCHVVDPETVSFVKENFHPMNKRG